uniref:CCHC-type domain-containing protein n=1 Tax=Dicentrarchus labrax TaxID=13489 RepID=A0A8C4E3X3_DICLA
MPPHFEQPPTRRPFDPNDKCYECGEKGHYAYDCHRYSRGSRRSRPLYLKRS